MWCIIVHHDGAHTMTDRDLKGVLADVERDVEGLADRCAGGRPYEYAVLCIHYRDGAPDTAITVIRDPACGVAPTPHVLASPPPRGAS